MTRSERNGGGSHEIFLGIEKAAFQSERDAASEEAMSREPEYGASYAFILENIVAARICDEANWHRLSAIEDCMKQCGLMRQQAENIIEGAFNQKGDVL